MRIVIFAALLLAVSIESAHADCTSDFNQLLHNNVSAGPYEVKNHFFEKYGDKITDETTDTLKSIYPDEIEDATSGPIFPIKILITKDNIWSNNMGKWNRVSTTENQSLLNHLFSRGYLNGATNNVECAGEHLVDGIRVISFKFDYESGLPSHTIQLHSQMDFDSVTHHPLKASGQEAKGPYAVGFTSIYTFDPHLKISPPNP